MEAEKILSTITEKLGQTSLSDRTIQKYIELNPIAEGEEPSDDYFNSAVSFLSELGGQYNHDIAVKVKDLKAQFAPASNTEGASTVKKAEPVDDKYNNVLKELQELKEEISDNERNRAQAEIKANVIAVMRAKNATDEYVLKNTLKGVTFDDSKTIDELAETYLKEYDKEFAEARGAGAQPRTSNGGKGLTAADAYFKSKAKREGWDSKQ